MTLASGCPPLDLVCDPYFIPSPPQEAYFDSARQAWILTRYRDVQAALRERGLHQASPRGESFPTGENEAIRAEQFAQVRTEIAEVHRGRWRADMEREARSVLRNLDGRKVIDLIGDVTLPWSITMLMKMSGASASSGADLTRIAASLLYKKAFNMDLEESAKPSWLRAPGTQFVKLKDPEGELDALTARGELAISKMMFFAMAQSMPAFLAKAWLALLQNPSQLEMLAAEPSRMPQAVPELLRYAGIVHALHRKAARAVQIGSAWIEEGDRVELRVASANFDPEMFLSPERLDITRPTRPPLSLGGGLHACTGAVLVRQALTATTSALLTVQARLVEDQRIVWMGDSTLRWPLAVWVQ